MIEPGSQAPPSGPPVVGGLPAGASGAAVALLAEYARAVEEFCALLATLDDRALHAPGRDARFATLRDLVGHMQGAGAFYADTAATAAGATLPPALKAGADVASCQAALRAMIARTALAVAPAAMRSAEDFAGLKVPWDAVGTMEALLEHAIVHVLRHRRQVEGWLGAG